MAVLQPVGHGQALTAQLLAANAAPAMGPIRTVAPQQLQSRSVNLMDEVQKERAYNRNFYLQKDAQQAALALEAQRNDNKFKQMSKENEYRLGQLEKGNEYSIGVLDKKIEQENTMFGITKEHQLAMEGLRKSNNLEVQKAAQAFETKMASITRNFQIRESK